MSKGRFTKYFSYVNFPSICPAVILLLSSSPEAVRRGEGSLPQSSNVRRKKSRAQTSDLGPHSLLPPPHGWTPRGGGGRNLRAGCCVPQSCEQGGLRPQAAQGGHRPEIWLRRPVAPGRDQERPERGRGECVLSSGARATLRRAQAGHGAASPAWHPGHVSLSTACALRPPSVGTDERLHATEGGQRTEGTDSEEMEPAGKRLLSGRARVSFAGRPVSLAQQTTVWQVHLPQGQSLS